MLVQNHRIKPVSDKICYETSTMALKNLPYSIAHPPMAAIGMSSTKR
ncbi:MAG TPA: hypothetical protein VFG46_12250 [Chryseolinea sp.]|nr:hypothetical protein [Chryseolinea sp.]